jgi:hypothetical protein
MSSTSDLITWLKDRHAALKSLEADAEQALQDKHDEQEYRDLMRKRAEGVAALEQDSAVLVEALPEPSRSVAQQALARFSAGGRNALSIGSVFYMSALLYPDEYQQGDPDNLELLIAELEQS